MQQFVCCNKYGIWKVCRMFICIKELPSSTIHLKSLLRVCFSGCQWPSSSFDSMPTSQDPVGALLHLLSCAYIKDLNLRDCHLSAILHDIGYLSLLNVLRLSGNDFVSLPESISQTFLDLDCSTWMVARGVCHYQIFCQKLSIKV